MRKLLVALFMLACSLHAQVPIIDLGMLRPSGATINQCVVFNGTRWVPGNCSSTSGTVTSVGLAAPGIFTVTGSPVTTTGTLTLNLVPQTANQVWAGPTTGSAAAPVFRALVSDDIPGLSASKITSGTFADARIAQSNVTQHQAALSLGFGQLTFTGLTTGQVLRATGATSAAFGALDLANGSAITGNLPVTNLNSGTGASATTFWRGDGTWAQVAYSQVSGTPSLGDSAALNVGTTAGTVAAGDDARFHAAVTLSGAPNYITLSGQEIIRNLVNLGSHVTGVLPVANGGTGANLSATGGSGQVLKQTTLGGAVTVGALAESEVPALPASKITSGTFADARVAASNVTQHQAALSIGYGQLTGVPSTFAPSAHAASHQHGGSDEVATATPSPNAIPKTGAGSTLADGWLSSNVPLLNIANTFTEPITVGAGYGSIVGTATELTITGGNTAGTDLVLRTSSHGTKGNYLLPDLPDCASLETGSDGTLACGTGGGGGGGGDRLADPGANGVVVRTALNTTTARTITGTASQVTVTNGDGVSGNPTISLPATINVDTSGNAATATTVASQRNAADFTGGDCGAKINAALSAGGSTAHVLVDQACGGTISTAVTATAFQVIEFVECGVWTVSAAITGGHIHGTGNGAPWGPSRGDGCVRFAQANGANLAALVTMNTDAGSLRDIEIDGNKAANSGTVGVRIDGAFAVELRNVHIKNAPSHGIHVVSSTTSSNDAQGAQILSTRVFDSGGHGLLVEHAQDPFVLTSGFEGNAGDGIRLINSGAARVQHSDMAGNGGDCLYIGGTTGGLDAGLVIASGNQCGNMVGDGFVVDGHDGTGRVADKNVFVGNTFWANASMTANTFDAIRLEGSLGNIVSANHIQSHATATFRYGINATDTTNSGGDTWSSNTFTGEYGTGRINPIVGKTSTIGNDNLASTIGGNLGVRGDALIVGCDADQPNCMMLQSPISIPYLGLTWDLGSINESGVLPEFLVHTDGHIASRADSYAGGTFKWGAGTGNVATATHTNTAARTYTFPDKDGTVAMLSDVPVTKLGSGVGSTTTGTSTTYVTMATVTIPGGTLAVGDIVRVINVVQRSGSTSANIQCSIQFGGVRSNATSASTGVYRCEYDILVTGSSAQTIVRQSHGAGTNTVAAVTQATAAIANDINVVIEALNNSADPADTATTVLYSVEVVK